MIAIDSTSALPPNTNRSSVRITSTDAYNIGTLAIVDLSHIPFGKSPNPLRNLSS